MPIPTPISKPVPCRICKAWCEILRANPTEISWGGNSDWGGRREGKTKTEKRGGRRSLSEMEPAGHPLLRSYCCCCCCCTTTTSTCFCEAPPMSGLLASVIPNKDKTCTKLSLLSISSQPFCMVSRLWVSLEQGHPSSNHVRVVNGYHYPEEKPNPCSLLVTC